MQNQNTLFNQKIVSIWLFCCCFCVLLMVMVGGITRITRSGLSITEWNPITGAILPLTNKQWTMEFSKYQRIPEFQIINNKMTLEEFKSIFYVEYSHRLLARTIFFVCIIPLIYFFYRKFINKKLFFRFLLIFSLIGIQGLVGWYMVKSGLNNRVNVNEIWLASHLCLALLIFSLIFWQGLKIQYHNISSNIVTPNLKKQKPIFLFILTFIFMPLQIFLGGVVAGLHILHLCFQNSDQICKFKFLDVIQYQNSLPFLWAHKLLAFTIFFSILIVIFTTLKQYKILSSILFVVLIMQIIFGIVIIFLNPESNLINYLAVAHQVNGFLLYGGLLYGFFLKKYRS